MTAGNYSNGDDILLEEPVDFQTAQSIYTDYAYEHGCYGYVAAPTDDRICPF